MRLLKETWSSMASHFNHSTCNTVCAWLIIFPQKKSKINMNLQSGALRRFWTWQFLNYEYYYPSCLFSTFDCMGKPGMQHLNCLYLSCVLYWIGLPEIFMIYILCSFRCQYWVNGVTVHVPWVDLHAMHSSVIRMTLNYLTNLKLGLWKLCLKLPVLYCAGNS